MRMLNSTSPLYMSIFLLAACASEPSDNGDEADNAGSGSSASVGGTGTGVGGNGSGGADLGAGGQVTSGGSESSGGASVGGAGASGGAFTAAGGFLETGAGGEILASGGGLGAGGSLPTGDGGAASGGDGNESGGETGSGGGESLPPEASAGCGMSSSGVGNINDAIVTFPAGYDGSTPMPMIFGFHGANRTNTQFQNDDARTKGHALESAYIMVYLKSDGSDWLAASNKNKVDNVYNTMLTNNCVDTNRVFAIGHSSGAQFITTLLCGGDDRFLGVAPVAGGIIGQCNSHPAINALYIHGAGDKERGNNGQSVVDLLTSENSCSANSSPYDQAGCQSGGTAVNPGCKEYADCSHRTIWCSHNDPNYNNTNHGWPCFANDAIKTFFDSL